MLPDIVFFRDPSAHPLRRYGMLPKSLSTRSVVFAFLMGPPRTLTRQEGMEFHDAVCRKLGADDFSFRYSAREADPPATGKAFEIALERPQGRGQFKITLDHQAQHAPVRFFVESPWPRSREAAFEDVDLAWEAAMEALDGGWERVLAETRLICKVDANAESAVQYMAQKVLHLSQGERDSLEQPLSFVGLKYETEAAAPTEGDPLAYPKREVSVEVLRDDPRCLYLELMSQWPQVSKLVDAGTLSIDASNVRTFPHPPTEYLQDSVQYLNAVVLPLFSRS